MRHKHIRMLIKPGGECSIDAVNFTDAGCQRLTQEITQALSAEVTADRVKPEAVRQPPLADRGREAAR